MIPKLCPICGTPLIKEEMEMPRTEDYSGSISHPQLIPSNCAGGSVTPDVSIERRPSYIHKCPNCGYAYIQWY